MFSLHFKSWISTPYLRLTVIFIFAFIAFSFAVVGHAKAFTPNYNSSNLIDDPTLLNNSSMSSSSIQIFLSNLGSGLTRVTDVEACDSTDSNLYAHCGQRLSAAQIVYDAGQAYGLNPRAILATMEKEQSLVTDPSPSSSQINCAMGYNSCGGYVGFFTQVDWGTYTLRFNYEGAMRHTSWLSYDPATHYPCANAAPGFYSAGLYPGNKVTFYDSGGTAETITLANAATASLYCYTPYVGPYSVTGYSGSYNFVYYYELWFGSTTYNEPTGGILYSLNGQVYLATTDNNTAYYIPSPSMLNNYGLGGYQIIPTTSTTINQYTSGGTLGSLLIDGSTGNVYLVNNGWKYYIPGPSICTAWGFNCGTAMQLGSYFQSTFLKTSSTNLDVLASSNYVIYEMSSGQKEPIADPATFNSLGFSYSKVIVVSGANFTQPLGPLLISTPTAISFAPSANIYYFDGQNFHYIPSPDVLKAWNFTVLSPPTSSYNTTPPTLSTDLDTFSQSGSNDYLIDSGRKILLNTSQQQLFPSAQYQTFSFNAASSLPDAQLQTYADVNNNFYKLDSGDKRYIASLEDLSLLGVSKTNTQTLSSYTGTMIASGNQAFGTGALLKSSSDGKIYVIAGDNRLYIPSPDTFNAFDYSWSKVRTYSDTIMTGYPSSGSLGQTVHTSSGYSFLYNGTRTTISSSQATDYGLINASYQSVPDYLVSCAKNVQNMTAFIRNNDNGSIYYASGGALHYVSSNASFMAYGGSSTPMTLGNSAIINSFNIAQPI